MASVASQLIEEVTAHAQSAILEDAREICADGTYFPNNLRIFHFSLRSWVQALLVLGKWLSNIADATHAIVTKFCLCLP